MNPELFRRIDAGGFARVTLADGEVFSGYIGLEHPSLPNIYRMDGYLLSDSGYLQEASIRLFPDDIRSIHFLAEAPEYTDRENTTIHMREGFFPHLS